MNAAFYRMEPTFGIDFQSTAVQTSACPAPCFGLYAASLKRTTTCFTAYGAHGSMYALHGTCHLAFSVYCAAEHLVICR